MKIAFAILFLGIAFCLLAAAYTIGYIAGLEKALDIIEEIEDEERDVEKD